jgi:hypothetical protein
MKLVSVESAGNPTEFEMELAGIRRAADSDKLDGP